MTIDQCGDAIDQAVALDRTQAPSYRSLNGCVAAEGADRCSMSLDGVYRAQVQAFLVTLSKPPTAQPLYPSLDGSIGFRGIAKQAVNITDDSYTVSAAAQAIAHENADKAPV